VDKIETEKQFKPKSQFIDIKLDIFAQSKDKRIIIEIQKVEYDYHFDRFQYYFLTTINEQQKTSKKYKIDQTVYSIVVLTTPYTINQLTGEPIENEVLIQNLDPETLEGKKIKISGHTQVFLNPHYRSPNTPKRIVDWLDLIYASIKTPDDYVINTKNIGIKRASELIDYEKLDENMRMQIKIENEKKALHAILENKGEIKGRDEREIEIAKKLILLDIDIKIIQASTGLEIESIEKLIKELKKRL